MAGVVEGFRWMLLGAPWPGGMLWVSVLAGPHPVMGRSLLLPEVEDSFADVV